MTGDGTVIVGELMELRRTRNRRRFEAEDLPADAAAAYAVAAQCVAQSERAVAAWKLGATTATTRAIFATETIYFGAIFADEMWTAGQSSAHVPPPVFRAEAEIALRLRIDIPSGQGRRLAAELGPKDIFDAWTPALEAPYSCIENIPGAGLVGLLSDRCAAGALFLGAAKGDVLDPAMDDDIAILIDGVEVCAAKASTALLMSPVAAALGFLGVASDQGVAMERGQWISTGGITPCIDLPLDGRAIGLRFGGHDVFTLDLAAQPGLPAA